MASFRFVLVRPINALNIGAAARALANFGFDELWAVNPQSWSWRDARSAVYEAKVRDRVVPTLDEALEGCTLVLGTASAHNRELKQTLVDLPKLAGWLKRRKASGTVAVLFGSERTGLSNDELSRCHALLRIPTSPEAPSMNLGQAFAVTAYALAGETLPAAVVEPELKPLETVHLEALVETAMGAMAKVKVNAHMSEKERRRKARLGFLRWGLSDTDATWLKGLLDRLTRNS